MLTTTTGPDAARLADSVGFAERLFSVLAADGAPDGLATKSAAYAAYMAAVRALQEHPASDTISAADEAAHTWAGACHAAGVRFGVAAEALRQPLLAGGSSSPW